MSDNLIIRLKDGVVEREKRWQGDTHDDLGGWVDYEATDKLMAEAAAELTRLRAKVEVADKLAEVLRRADDGICNCDGPPCFNCQSEKLAIDAALSAYEGSKE